MKVYVENHNGAIERMFREEDYALAGSVFCADLLCLEGGADVTPSIYGEVNYASNNSQERDIKTFGLIAIAKRRGIPVVGICRGAQALNVYNGGKMVQDIPGHAIPGTHKLKYHGVEFDVTSTHHQMMVPGGMAKTSVVSDDGVTEIVTYNHHNQNDLCFQPHPEFTNHGSSCRELFFKLMHDWLL